MTDGDLCVHAVVRAGHGLRTTAHAVPVRLVAEDGVAAVVSVAPERLLPRDLLAHQDLLMDLAQDGPVLPMRFGTVAPDEAVVRRQLTAAREENLDCLRRVAGRVEINVKAMPATEALAALVRQDPAIQRLRATAARSPSYEASLRLGEAVAAAFQRRAARAGQDVVHELSRLAHEACPGPEVAGCAVNASFLVDRDAAEEFRRVALEAAAVRRDEVDLRVVGPLPCYSFTKAGHAAVRTGV
jgi:hypothetical protein